MGAKQRSKSSMSIPFKTSIAAILFLAIPLAKSQEHVTAEDVLQRHLDSIGTAAVRDAMKSRVVEATASYRVLQGGSGQFEGKAVVASAGRQLHMLLKISAPQFTGERFISNGQKIGVEGTYPGKDRSAFGSFLYAEDAPLREGLLGGVLSTAWPLLNWPAHRGQLRYEGPKNVGGTSLLVMAYRPGGRSGLEITLYFDPATYRHVRSVYAEDEPVGIYTSSQSDIARASEAMPTRRGMIAARPNARLSPIRWKIEEQFSNFKTVDGMTLPAHYDLRFEELRPNGSQTIVQYDVNMTRVMNNIPVDARNFQIP